MAFLLVVQQIIVVQIAENKHSWKTTLTKRVFGTFINTFFFGRSLTSSTILWHNPNNDERVENIDKKISQLKARKQAIVNRERQAERKADTRRKIIIGGIFLKYFPDCKTIDPKDNKNFARVANAIAALANDKEFFNLWFDIKQKMKSGV
jgi:hypothetical protein